MKLLDDLVAGVHPQDPLETIITKILTNAGDDGVSLKALDKIFKYTLHRPPSSVVSTVSKLHFKKQITKNKVNGRMHYYISKSPPQSESPAEAMLLLKIAGRTVVFPARDAKAIYEQLKQLLT